MLFLEPCDFSHVRFSCIALILIYQRLYTSRNYSCSYPTIKGKELNSNGIPVKQADRTFGQFAGHHF